MKKLLLLFAICFIAVNIPAEVIIGDCGQDLHYTLNTEAGTLTITGSGNMYNYGWSGIYQSSPPWEEYKDHVTHVSLPEGLTNISSEAFSGFSNLVSLNIPTTVETIGASAFRDCSNWSDELVLPNGITIIGKSAFSGCSKLSGNLVLPNSLTTLYTFVFAGCSSLTSVTMNNTLLSIPDYTFENCTALQTVTVGNAVKDIGREAFAGCSSLTSINIPDSVTLISYAAFRGCNNLTRVDITNLTAWCNINFGGSNGYEANPLYFAKRLYLNGEEITHLMIPDGVTEIKPYAFWGFTGMTELTLPNTVTKIGKYAFYECKGLRIIHLPNSISEIDENAFVGCENIWGDLVLPDSLTSIGEAAFGSCMFLLSITLPASLAHIGNYAFTGCNNLRTIYNCSDLDIVAGSEDYGEVALNATNVYGCPGEIPNGIENATVLPTDGVRYNVLGQPVSEDYKGIVIINGEKYLMR